MTELEEEAPGVTRKLTTIFHADVCGYSRLMEQDEVATLSALKECKSVTARFLDRHRGRLINWTGDGLLAEFASVVEAVQCGVEIQKELKARNDLLEDDRRMDFRIGINLGDVMVDNEELFGEGVNIAARLQSIAPVGGILMSGTAFDQVRNKLSLEFDFMGRQSVKNIAEQIPAYAVVLDPNTRPSSQRMNRSTEARDDYQMDGNPGSIGAPPPPGAATEGDAQTIFPGPYAGFWRRSVAFLIDWGLVMVVAFTLSDLTGGDFEPFMPLAYVLYLGAFESSTWQASIGKKVLGIQVVDLQGRRLDIFHALGRNFAKLLSILTLFYGFAMAGWSQRKQGLHDKIADAMLIDVDGLPQAHVEI